MQEYFRLNKKKAISVSIVISLVLISLIGCVANKQYRTDYTLCVSDIPGKECQNNSLQRFKSKTNSNENYSLGFIEFDDQGQFHDRKQSNILIDSLYADAHKNNLMIVVFVHGWQHDASANDDYIVNFRETLRQLSIQEYKAAELEKRNKREVAGVFLGWRGKSMSIPLLNTLTFWERKATAHKIGNGGVVEVLTRLEELRNIKATVDESKPLSMTRLVIIGHSFGGAVVYTSLSQILMERFIQTKGPLGVTGHARGFGDLVVLINPAFEAMQFANLSNMANERGVYFDGQLPILTVLTSESDLATKYAFPAGRFFSNLLESYKETSRYNKASKSEQSVSEASADRSSIGHFDSFKTHRLEHKDGVGTENEMDVYQRVQNEWDDDDVNGRIDFSGSTLIHEDNSIGRNPYLIIKVDKKIIPNHSDIFDPRVAEFIRHFILLSTQDDKLVNEK